MAKRKTPETLTGHCASALAVSGGTLSSTTDADVFHRLCRGVLSPISDGGRPFICGCKCHKGEGVGAVAGSGGSASVEGAIRPPS